MMARRRGIVVSILMGLVGVLPVAMEQTGSRYARWRSLLDRRWRSLPAGPGGCAMMARRRGIVVSI